MSVFRVTGKGNYNVLCDVCGFKMKASEVKKRWDGFMVCKEDWEPRHPLDFYAPPTDVFVLPFTRPDSDGIDVGPAINSTTTTTPAPR